MWYARGPVREWYVNGPLGLEQGFTIPHRLPGGSGPLALSLAVGGLRPVLARGSVVLDDARGASVLRYAGLVATDARGAKLAAWSALRAGRVELRVDDRRALYPLRIDPFVQQAKLVATGKAGQGYSVAVSADGNTALVGAPSGGVQCANAGTGAALVFTRSGSTWRVQATLVGSDAVGCPEEGSSVALSADGNTALVGGAGDGYPHGAGGAAWVFTRSGSTWSQQGPKLVGTGGDLLSEQGRSVALSADGNTALIGGENDYGDLGAVWVFTRAGSTWSQQGPKLVGTGADVGGAGQGRSVALSADGNTALVGGPLDGYNEGVSTGAAWVFTRSGSTWSQQGSKLVGTGAVGAAYEGSGVGLSGDGSTALIGGPGDNGNIWGIGAAWVFTRSGSTWSQQGSKLVGTGVTGPIASQGFSVALSGDGSTALIGGPSDDSIGAAWVFGISTPPSIGSITPTSGITGSSVTITGTYLGGASSVKFGSLAASFTEVSSTQVMATVPDGAAAGKVSITTPAGTATSSQSFTPTLSVTSMSPTSGPYGTVVGIRGVGFTPGSTVKFNGAAATVSYVNSSLVKATVPSAATTGPVTLTNFSSPTGTVKARTSYAVTPHIAPTISSFTPTSGITGSSVTITGTYLSGASSVKFGGVAASSFSVRTPTTLAATVPNGAATGKISVATAAGTATSSQSFTPTLSITGFSPGSGPPGTVVDIKGIGFTPTSTVQFNGTAAAAVAYIGSGEVTATVPTGATSGQITLTNTASPVGTGRSAKKYVVS